MSEVLKRVVCVRLAMSESLARSRFALGRVTRQDDAPMDRKAAMSSGSLGGGTGSETLGAHGGCPRPLRGLAIGLVAVSALVVAVPTEAQTNTAPTAMDGAVTLVEDSEHFFTAAEFNFSDADSGAALASVRVVETPALGSFVIRATSIVAQDGSAVSANTLVTKAVIDAGRFYFRSPIHANGSPYTTFTFKVSDGTDESVATYTMTINITLVNDPPTGKPRITGTPHAGETLTASVSGIGDVDGLTNPGYTYQWIRVGGGTSNIAGATASTYTLTNADATHRVRVRVMFTDDDGTPETVTSDVYPEGPGPVLGLPTAVRNFGARAGDGRVRLEWNDPQQSAGKITGDVPDYQYRYAPGATVPAGTAWSSANHFVQFRQLIAGLTNGTPYAFELRAVNTVGAGPTRTATATPMTVACPAPALGNRRRHWYGDLTLAPHIPPDGDVEYSGFISYEDPPGGSLSDTDFTLGAQEYVITAAWVGEAAPSIGHLFVDFDRDLADAHKAALRLHVCDTPSDFSAGDGPYYPHE